jgi:gliding motility-associated-like protein
MKKLLLLTFAAFCLSFVTNAQCKTCHLGQHDPNDSSMYAKVTPNGSGTLGQSYIQQNVCGLNYVTASVLTETRSKPYAFNANGTGFPAPLVVSGLPTNCITIQKAFLYYEASYTEATPPATTATVTNPIPSTATYGGLNIGTAGTKCWGETGSVTYRADVTAAISGNGTYTVNLNGFANAAWEVDGMTLVIIYTSNGAYSGSISLWDGDIVNYYILGPQTMSGFTVCAASATASAFGVFGDIQSNVNGNQNTDTFNGSTATFANNFWNCNIINTTVTSGQTTSVFNPYTNNGGDCYSWSLAGLYWQNTTCVTCTAGSMTVTPTQVNPTCGNNNGSINIGITGGTGPYTYTWTPPVSTTASASNLSAGTYSITVKDAGCNTSTVVVTLTTTSLSLTTAVTANVKCNGGATGSGNVTASGGTSPYTYSWSTIPVQTSSTATGLTAGTYTVTVTDKTGCTNTASITITQPPLLTATAGAATNVKCNGGNNGSDIVTAAGGTPAYTYSWNTIPVQTTSTATGLTAGTYTCTVTDANGCTVTTSVTITQPPVLTATTGPATNVKCNGGATGSDIVTAAGGTPNYTYSWSTIPVQTSSAATGLTAGTYTVTVTDANGCTATASVTITQPPVLTAIIGPATNVKCNGGNNGSDVVTAGGGTPNYTYSWSTIPVQTSSTATGLTAGSYTVTVTDANGCTATASVTVTQPPVLTATAGPATNVLCNGSATGSDIVTAGGGTPNYTYSWTTIPVQTTANATGLSAGTYTCTVTDANGCTATTSVTITQPTALNATTTTVSSTCGNANGSATANPTGGTGTYTYSWATSPVQTTQTATNLTAGTYTVTVTDANGCTFTTTATVANITGETVNITTIVNVLCNGGNNGSASPTVTGGTGPYTYSWSTSPPQTSSTATGLTAGSYTLSVTDANGCLATASVTITQPPLLIASTNGIVNVLCNAGSNGSATANPTGGTPNYTYSWNTIPVQTTPTATGLSAGTYTVTVTDANGCTATASATITQPPVLTVTTAAPTNILCNGGNNGSDIATAGGGTPNYTYSWNTTPVQTTPTATGLSAGTYTITVTDANGCTATANVTVTQPTALTCTTTFVPATCSYANGSATAAPGGGTPGYTYSWNTIPVQTTPTATGLTAGTYTVTITDANGCTLTTSCIVNNIPGETVSIASSVNVSCNGGNNGSATPLVTGGTPNYTYSWSTIPVQTTSNATGLTAGTYTLTVTDANGCIATASVTISQPPVLTVTTSAPTNVLCNGGNNGSDIATPNGGTGPYTYSWNTIPVQTTPNANGLTAGTYTITVTDANGCTATASTTITQPPALTLVAAGFPVTCNGGNNGQGTAIPAGGTPGYTYAWSNGFNGANDNNLTAGNYKIIVTDANGCSVDTTVTVTQPAPIVVAFNADTINGCAPLCTGLVDGTSDPNGTVTKWSWTYSDGGSDTTKDPRHCFNAPGSYDVSLSVTDNHGCAGSLTINNMITVYSFPVPAFTMGPQPTTIENPTITFTDKSTDAYGIASWLWNFADPLNDAPSSQQNPSHTYGDTGTFCATLTVTNIHGCKDSITECLIINPQYELYIPDAFSPDGDGKNDIFQPKGEYMSSYKMYIFDRWGMLLFYTDDFNKGWNGTVNNGSTICQQDTYVYMIEATDNLGQQHKYIGKVTLLK